MSSVKERQRQVSVFGKNQRFEQAIFRLQVGRKVTKKRLALELDLFIDIVKYLLSFPPLLYIVINTGIVLFPNMTVKICKVIILKRGA